MPKKKSGSAYKTLLDRKSAEPDNFSITSRELFDVLDEINRDIRMSKKTKAEQEAKELIEEASKIKEGLKELVTQKSKELIEGLYQKWNAEEKTEKTSELSDLEKKKIEDNLREPNFIRCNVKVYCELLPYAELMYEIERNGNASVHAFKLAVLFDSSDRAMDFLYGYFGPNFEAKTKTMHNAMLMRVPQDPGIDWGVWQEVSCKFLSRKRFDWQYIETILPRAKELQDLIVKKSSGKTLTAETRKQISELMIEIDKIYARFRVLEKKDVADLTDDEEREFTKLTSELRELRLNLVEMGVPFSKQLTMTEFGAFLESLFSETHTPSKKIFDKYGLTQRSFERFIKLERVNDDTLIPNIEIDGEFIDDEKRVVRQESVAVIELIGDEAEKLESNVTSGESEDLSSDLEDSDSDDDSSYGSGSDSDSDVDDRKEARVIEREIGRSVKSKNKYKGFYLMKLDVMDEVEAARAACLGVMTNCCQSMTGEAGEPCAIHGLTSPDSGFYILCKGDVNDKKPTDRVIAQSWTWRSVKGAIVFDSIETWSGVEDNKKLTRMVVEFYQSLARRLVIGGYTDRVHCGDCQLEEVTDDIGVVSGVREQLNNYNEYCDSAKQVIIADNDCPVFWYEKDVYWQDATKKHVIAALNAMDTADVVNMPLVNNFVRQLNLLIISERKDLLRIIANIVYENVPGKVKIYKKILRILKLFVLESYRDKKEINHDEMIRDMITKTLLLGGGWVFINIVDDRLRSLLHWAALKDKFDAVKILIDAGVALDAESKDSMTALQYAIENKNFDMCAALIRAGAETHVGDFIRVLKLKPRKIYKLFLTVLDKSILQNILAKPKDLVTLLGFLDKKDRLFLIKRLDFKWVGSNLRSYHDLISVIFALSGEESQVFLKQVKSNLKISALKNNKEFKELVISDEHEFDRKLIEWQQSILNFEILEKILSRLRSFPDGSCLSFLNRIGFVYLKRIIINDSQFYAVLFHGVDRHNVFSFVEGMGVDWIRENCKTQANLRRHILYFMDSSNKLRFLKLLGLDWLSSLPWSEGSEAGFEFHAMLNDFRSSSGVAISEFIQWVGVENIYKFYEKRHFRDHVGVENKVEYRTRCTSALNEIKKYFLEAVESESRFKNNEEKAKIKSRCSLEAMLLITYLLKSGFLCEPRSLFGNISLFIEKRVLVKFFNELGCSIVQSSCLNGQEFIAFLKSLPQEVLDAIILGFVHSELGSLGMWAPSLVDSQKSMAISGFHAAWMKSVLVDPALLKEFIACERTVDSQYRMLERLNYRLTVDFDKKLLTNWVDSMQNLRMFLRVFLSRPHAEVFPVISPFLAANKSKMRELIDLGAKLSKYGEQAPYFKCLCVANVTEFAGLETVFSGLESKNAGELIDSFDVAWLQPLIKNMTQLIALLQHFQFKEKDFLTKIEFRYIASLVNQKSDLDLLLTKVWGVPLKKDLLEKLCPYLKFNPSFFKGSVFDGSDLLSYMTALNGVKLSEFLVAVAPIVGGILSDQYEVTYVLKNLPDDKKLAFLKVLCPVHIKKHCIDIQDLISFIKFLPLLQAKQIVQFLDIAWVRELTDLKNKFIMVGITGDDQPYYALLTEYATSRPATQPSQQIAYPASSSSQYSGGTWLFGGGNLPPETRSTSRPAAPAAAPRLSLFEATGYTVMSSNPFTQTPQKGS